MLRPDHPFFGTDDALLENRGFEEMRNTLFIKKKLGSEHIVNVEIQTKIETETSYELFLRCLFPNCSFSILKYKKYLETCDCNYRLSCLFHLTLSLGCMTTIMVSG